MTKRTSAAVAAGLAVALTIGLMAAQARRPRIQAQPTAAQPADKNSAGDDISRPADTAAIRKAADSFIKAFQSGDAKALSAHWTAEGEFISDDGTALRGRPAIEKAYAEFFKKNPNPQAEIEVTSLRFPSRDTAVEESFFKVRRGKAEEKTTSRSSVLYVREGGKWLMAVVREWPSEGTSLRDLEWLVGDWSSSRDGVEVRTKYEWDLNKSFLRGRFTIKDKDRNITGTQMIGKDPATGQLRSWTFESEGGFGHAIWSRDGNKWIVEADGINGDGGTLSATNILSRVGEDSYTWQGTNRTLDGDEQPNIPPIKVSRVKNPK